MMAGVFSGGLHDVECHSGSFGKAGSAGGRGNGLIVATAASKQIMEFAMPATEVRVGLIGFEAPHTSN
jgi:hypothetical protein